MWPFRPQTYELLLEFAGNPTEELKRAENAREILSRQLQSGQVGTCQVNTGKVVLSIASSYPKLCLGEVGSCLEKTPFFPQVAKFRNTKKEKWVQMWSVDK